jgi:hypothetical protein
MRRLFIILFLANLAVTILAPYVLPTQVAIHFGMGGQPDSWTSRGVFVLIFLAFQVPLFFLLLYVPALILKCPAKIVSLPNRDYWLAEENKQRTGAMLSRMMSEYGAALFASLLGMGLLTIYANLSAPVRLNESLFLVLFCAFMAYTAYWCIRLFREFRIPAGE